VNGEQMLAFGRGFGKGVVSAVIADMEQTARRSVQCTAVWQRIAWSAFSARGVTGTYECVQHQGHDGDHVGRLIGTTIIRGTTT
jgi:hypothetical protein